MSIDTAKAPTKGRLGFVTSLLRRKRDRARLLVLGPKLVHSRKVMNFHGFCPCHAWLDPEFKLTSSQVPCSYMCECHSDSALRELYSCGFKTCPCFGCEEGAPHRFLCHETLDCSCRIGTYQRFLGTPRTNIGPDGVLETNF